MKTEISMIESISLTLAAYFCYATFGNYSLADFVLYSFLIVSVGIP